jgi:hypothetical protein
MRATRTFLAAFVLAAAAFVAAPSVSPASTDSQSWLIDYGADGSYEEAWIFYDSNGKITEI